MSQENTIFPHLFFQNKHSLQNFCTTLLSPTVRNQNRRRHTSEERLFLTKHQKKKTKTFFFRSTNKSWKTFGKMWFPSLFLLFRTCDLLGHWLLDMYELNETFNLTETDEYFVCNKGVYCVCSMLVARYTQFQFC